MTETTTINYYNSNADAFYAQTANVDMSAFYARFLVHMPPGGHILDAGCGSGRDALAFLDRGYQVTAFDASASLARRASALLGQEVRCYTFDDVGDIDAFDGVWACASLLHVDEDRLHGVIGKLMTSLHSGGVLYASFKKGDGTRTDEHGRRFTNMTLASLYQLIDGIEGLALLEAWETADQRLGRQDESWCNFVARKT